MGLQKAWSPGKSGLGKGPGSGNACSVQVSLSGTGGRAEPVKCWVAMIAMIAMIDVKVA